MIDNEFILTLYGLLCFGSGLVSGFLLGRWSRFARRIRRRAH